MTTLTGTIDNGKSAVTGKLVITLAGSMLKDTAPKKLFVPRPIELICTAGVIPTGTVIEESETKSGSYKFEYFPLLSSSPDVYSDFNIDPFPFFGVVPNQATVDITELAPTGMVNDVLSTGALRIAKIIAGDPSLASSIGGINPRGEYATSTFYKRGDIVSYLNRAFIAIEVVAFSDVVPINTLYWMEIPIQPTGTVGLGSTAVYGAGWNGSGLAPSQDSVYDIIQPTLTAIAAKADTANPALTGVPTAPTAATTANTTQLATTAYVKNNLANYATLASPTFTGDPRVPTASTADNDTTAASTAYVKNNLISYATLASPAFTGNPTSPTPPNFDNDTSIATTAFVKNSVAANTGSTADGFQNTDNARRIIVTNTVNFGSAVYRIATLSANVVVYSAGTPVAATMYIRDQNYNYDLAGITQGISSANYTDTAHLAITRTITGNFTGNYTFTLDLILNAASAITCSVYNRTLDLLYIA